MSNFREGVESVLHAYPSEEEFRIAKKYYDRMASPELQAVFKKPFHVGRTTQNLTLNDAGGYCLMQHLDKHGFKIVKKPAKRPKKAAND